MTKSNNVIIDFFDDPAEYFDEELGSEKESALDADIDLATPDFTSADEYLIDAEADLDSVDFTELNPKPKKGPGSRKPRTKSTPVSALTKSGEPLSIYDCLVEYDLLKKVTDIVLAKVAVPWHLRADAAQEVHCTWASLKANPTFAQNQVAHYAYLSGQHAALKLRRMIGAVVVIPGALFRTGRDTAFMEAIGAALNPKDVEDYRDSLELSTEITESMDRVVVSEQLLNERLADLNLSVKQRLVAEKALLRKMPAHAIAAEMSLAVTSVERMLNQVALKISQKDEARLKLSARDN